MNCAAPYEIRKRDKEVMRLVLDDAEIVNYANVKGMYNSEFTSHKSPDVMMPYSEEADDVERWVETGWVDIADRTRFLINAPEQAFVGMKCYHLINTSQGRRTTWQVVKRPQSFYEGWGWHS